MAPHCPALHVGEVVLGPGSELLNAFVFGGSACVSAACPLGSLSPSAPAPSFPSCPVPEPHLSSSPVVPSLATSSDPFVVGPCRVGQGEVNGVSTSSSGKWG